MKKLFLGICFLAFNAAKAQVSVRGIITDLETGSTLGGATVTVKQGGSVMADNNGHFSLNAVSYPLQLFVTMIGYRQFDTLIRNSPSAEILIRLNRINLFLQPIEVHSLRAGEKAPFTKTNISKAEIEKTNLGQDLPFLLNQTPSVVVNSDAGNGVGYTGIHIRGTDASRINMTLNGIPYNDAESQGIYFVDLPDFASSVNSIQVQRGIGTSSNGAGAFGATINFSTNEFQEKPYADINNSFGSFNTWKNTVKAGSGLLAGHYTVDMRLSRISSDGYIDRASSALKSVYFSAAWLNKNSSVRFNLLSGTEKTYQAWNGIPQAKLFGDRTGLDQHYENNLGSLYFTRGDSLNLYQSGNRTYNYFTYQNQTDNYQQDHYQLFFNHRFSDPVTFNAAIFLTRGRGYYEEYKNNAPYADYGLPDYVTGADTLSQTDLIRQRWLDNYFYGGIFSVQYQKAHTQVSIGGGIDQYDGKHYGVINWSMAGGTPPDYRYYSNIAHKSDANIYVKWQQQLNPFWSLFADMQFRNIDYTIHGFDDNAGLTINKNYLFFNPKAGLTFTAGNLMVYLSYSRAGHEPNRDDFEANEAQLPRPESLNDFEMGVEKRNGNISWGATVYYMQYQNQLVLTGKINDVGSYTRTNIPRSYRLGLELQGSIRLSAWMNAQANLTLSRNRINDFTEYIDDYDNGGQKAIPHHDAEISFSPAITGGGTVNILPVKNFTLSLLGKYVGKQFLDNTSNSERKLNPFYTQDLRILYTVRSSWLGKIDLIGQVNNVLNKKYEPNGYTYSYYYGGQLTTENFYFPMAGTNLLFAVNFHL